MSTLLEVKSRCEGVMYGPFLIAPHDSYWCSPTKVAFVGQETHEWSFSDDIGTQMATYDDFCLGKHYRPSPFWNIIRKLEKRLTGSTYCSAWLNLNRYDEAGKKPSWKNQVTLSELDFLLVEELKTIAVNVVIFFTGPFYDRRLARLLQSTDTNVAGFSARQLCQLGSTLVGGMIFRTYHPKYLRCSGLESRVIDAICGTVANRWSQAADDTPTLRCTSA